MARTLTEIYTLAKECRKQYLQLTEFENSSKMSILDAFTWTTSACIWAFENVMDVFKVDLARDLQNRVNGTPAYYANALLKFQYGDELEMNEEGTSFSYPVVNEDKRIITKVAYAENECEGFHDKELQLKVATGTAGHYSKLTDEQLIAARAYMNQIAFAGTHYTLVSRKGDVLIPRLTVYYDGAVSPEEVYNNINANLQKFIEEIPFDGVVYSQKIIDAIQRAEHVTDVYINSTETDKQGIFVAQYDDDNNLIRQADGTYEMKIGRYFLPNSGFIKESTMEDKTPEFSLPDWRHSIVLQIDNPVANNQGGCHCPPNCQCKQ